MARIVFVVANYKGHLNPTFSIARKLQARGDSVIYLGDEGIREAVLEQNFAFEYVSFLRPLGVLPQQQGSLLNNKLLNNPLKVWCDRRSKAKALLKELNTIPTEVSNLISKLKPDLMIFDPFFLCYYMPFWINNIPALSISVYPLFTYDPLVPPYTSRLIPGTTIYRRLLIQLAWAYQRLVYWWYRLGCVLQEFVNAYSSQLVVKRLAEQASFPLAEEWVTRPLRFDFALKCVPEIVLSVKEFDFPRERGIPNHTEYIGPCVDFQRYVPSFSWNGINGKANIILCSLSTVHHAHDWIAIHFLHKVIKAFEGDLLFELIIATGSDFLTHRLRSEKSNVHVYTFVPQLEILHRASVMITHGGFNSIKECIMMTVPMLVYPRRTDQPGNSARVVYHGLGLRARMSLESSDGIRQKVLCLLNDPSYRLRLAQMREHFIRYSNDHTELYCINKYLKGRESLLNQAR
ncbi:MAG: hypothetical protein NHB32_21170 [Fischerella sp. CENA71]|nr:hypothetical protein [Fischerella sp. CENA71]